MPLLSVMPFKTTVCIVLSKKIWFYIVNGLLSAIHFKNFVYFVFKQRLWFYRANSFYCCIIAVMLEKKSAEQMMV